VIQTPRVLLALRSLCHDWSQSFCLLTNGDQLDNRTHLYLPAIEQAFSPIAIVMSTTSTITIRSHSSQSHSPKNNSQGRPTCKVKVIERYKQPPTRLATSRGRKPATKDTSTSQATLREVNPNLTKAPVTARHKVLKFVSQSNGEADCEVCLCASTFIYLIITLPGISKYHSSGLQLYILQNRRLPCKTKVNIFQ
jgi:hypothetical protein